MSGAASPCSVKHSLQRRALFRIANSGSGVVDGRVDPCIRSQSRLIRTASDESFEPAAWTS